MLAILNHQLIEDEGHRNPMNTAELEERMRNWLISNEYHATIFEEHNEAIAYALFKETTGEVYLRQFFVVRHRRRAGIGRRAIQTLLNEYWPNNKRLTVSVLTNNPPAVAFWRSVGYKDYSLSLEIMPADRPENEETRKQ